MNLKRGLLRLWVLLALAWVAPTTWLLWDELTMSEHSFMVTTSDNRQYEIQGPPGTTKEQALQKFKDLEARKALPVGTGTKYKPDAMQSTKDQPTKSAEPGTTANERIALLDEAYKRGILPPDMKAANEEALKRGLVGAPPIRAQSADGVIHEFPAGTSMDVVDRVMKQYAQSVGSSASPQQSSKLTEFRQKHPEYNDMSDSAFADAMYRKYYSDMLRDQFNAKIGLTEEQATIADQLVANWPRRREAVAIVLLPPLGVLVIGIGLFWAAQGFRRRGSISV